MPSQPTETFCRALFATCFCLVCTAQAGEPKAPKFQEPEYEVEVCGQVDGSGRATKTECPGFTGAEFTCPDGWQFVKVKSKDFRQECGPYEL